METKSKKFTRKLIALILSILMAASCFTGALTAFAAETNAREYHDSNITANFMAWAETTDEQTAEAILDWADMHLGDLFEGLMGTTRIDITIPVLGNRIAGYLDSIDGILDITNSEDVKSLLNTANGGLGKMLLADVAYIDISPLQGMTPVSSGDAVISKCGKSYRANYSAKNIILRVAELLYRNSNTFANKNGSKGNLLGKFFRGTLSLGSILENNVLHGTVYSLLQGALGADNGYESNLVYNLVRSLIFNNTKWYTEEEIAQFKSGAKAWNFDEQLFGKLSSELIGEVSALVTYPNEVEELNETTGKLERVKDNSGIRRKKIDAYMEAHSCDYKTAASALGYDPNLVYHVPSNEETKDFANNINIFQYGDEKLVLSKDDTLFSFAYKALAIAWKSVLKPTLGLVNVYYNANRGNGTNFDNDFYYWMDGQNRWNTSDWKSNYSEANVRAWAEARCKMDDMKDINTADEFLAIVKHTLEFDRTVAEDAKGNWQDIDSTVLFNKLRYNPLADLYFNMQTGPINLYFRETGIKQIDDFFKNEYANYDNIVAGFNDCLCAAVDLIFPDSNNIGIQGAEKNVVGTNLARPTMQKTGNTTNIDTITNTLMSNALAIIEYVANTTDANILNAYYKAHGISSVSGNLAESNLEEAMLPLLISCLQNVEMVDPIHDKKWDACKDAEGVAVVALEEYLSYVLPDKTYDSLWSYDENGKIVATLEGTIMPMARDALGFIICPIVPCRTKDGRAWDVYTAPVNDTTTIFDILNSVIVNYAGTDSFADGTAGKGVASLLGMVDKNGNCLVKMSNTIWENLDIIVNQFLPVIGQLQYGTAGSKASSEDLIYNKVIKGFLDIGPNKGVSTFLKQFLTICTSDPIAKKGVDLMVYDDVLCPILNGLFGARYEGQGYDKVIPYSSYYDADKYSSTSSASPFDSLVQVDTIGKYSAQNDVDDGKETGIIGILICNIFEAFGGGGYSTSAKAGVDACWDAAMFAASAVNSFVPSFAPQLGQHTLNAATAEFDVAAESGLSANSSFTAKTLYVNNNSIGLNRYYKKADGSVEREPRYFIKIKDISVTDSKGNPAGNITVGGLSNNGIVAPEKSAKINITGTAPSGTETYAFDVVYDIYLGEGSAPVQTAENTIESNLETITYLSLSTDKSWRDIVYSPPTGGKVDFATGNIMTDTNYVTKSSGGSKYWGNMKLQAFIPKHSIIPMSDPSVVKDYIFAIKNVTNGTAGQDASADGLFAYPYAGDEYYTVNGSTIASTLTTAQGNDKSLGYAAIDSNGNILNYSRVDISDDGENWDRGAKSADTTSYEKNSINTKNMYQGYKIGSAETEGKATRPHVAWTFDDALAAGIIKGVNRVPAEYNADGSVKSYLYKSVLVSPNTLYLGGSTVEEAKYSISWSAGMPGLYFATSKTNQTKGTQDPYQLFAYDSSTANFTPQDYYLNISLYTTENNNMGGVTHVYIADDTAAAALKKTYKSVSDEMAPYRAQDFTDVSAYNNMKKALAASVAELARPVTLENAASLGSVTIDRAKKVNTSKRLGDKAYQPIKSSEGLPADILIGATKGSDGYWYYNKECTMPIYSNKELTDADVTNGKDAVGQAVEKNAEDGLYYLVNDIAYEQKWTQPSGVATPFQTDDTTKPIKDTYREISFVYRDANGKKVTSKDNWAYKLAETETVIKPYDGKDYRNIAAQQSDNLNYWIEKCRAAVNADIALEINEKITDKRKDMNNVNYDVAAYENMVKLAQRAEKLVKKEAIVDENGKPVLDENKNPTYKYSTTASSLQVAELVRLFDIQFNNRIYPRGYLGDKLEKEIVCATNYPYTALSETHVEKDIEIPAVTDKETGEVITPAKTEKKNFYTVTGAANQPAKYGAYNAEGVLVNEGDKVYTDKSWENYINALGEAVEKATAKTSVVSKTYDVKKNLQIAENELEEVTAADAITVSGTVMIATNLDGSRYSVGIRGIKILAGGVEVGTSAADGTFSVEVPVGTTELTFAGDTTVDRTVTLAGDANVADAIVPICVCDYNHDGYINGLDSSTYSSAYTGTYNVYCDFNGDGFVNGLDSSTYSSFYAQTVNYGALQLK